MQEAKKGPPEIVIVPFSGRGYYDYQAHLLITPSAGLSMDDAFLQMLANYRLKRDEEGRMVERYLRLDSRKVLIGSSKAVTERFTDDYLSWMGDDGEKFNAMPDDVKNWFESEFAPTGLAIHVPEYLVLSGQTINEVNKIILACKQRADKETGNTDAQFDLGVIFFYQKLFDRALDQFEKTLTLDPQHRDALYNRAILLEKTGQKDRAVEAWRGIQGTAPDSWLGRHASKKIKKILV